MEDHQQLSDIDFEDKFADCSLDPKVFTHEAHLRLTWIHIIKYGVDQAIINIPTQIKKYVASLGAQSKYNETVTIAGIKAVNHFIQHSEQDTFAGFISENKQLKEDFKGLLLTHYKTNIFESDLAKKEFIEPELLPF